MNMAVSHLRNMVKHIAPVTLENEKIRPNFPVNFSPRDSIGLSYKGNEFLKIPGSINNVLGSNLAVIIDIRLSFTAVKDLSLAHGEKLIAISTLIEVVILLLK